MKQLGWVLIAGLGLGACARQSDVNRVELQVRALRQETARADSARAVVLGQIFVLERRILDSLVLQAKLEENRLSAFRGDIRADLTEVQRQLVQVQELAGQSQQSLSGLRGQIEARAQALAAGTSRPGDSTATTAGSSSPGPEQLYELALKQLRQSSPQTARMAFQKLLADFPTHDRGGDAQFFIGESWGNGAPDSAAAAYDRVVTIYPASPRVPTALYRLGLIAEQKKDRPAARQYYTRLVAGFPRSDEATLARDKLQALGR